MSRASKILKLVNESTGYTETTSHHSHKFSIDENGNGKTMSTIPSSHEDHTHEIKDYKVLESNGHTHGKVKK